MKRKLKKSEYPEYISCLAIGCPICPYLKGMGFKSYKECPCLEWKVNNRNKYDITVEDGRIKSVYLLEEE